jgi:hypothetical protein
MGTNSVSRPWLEAFNSETNSGRWATGFHNSWLDLGTFSRSDFPIAAPSVREREGGKFCGVIEGAIKQESERKKKFINPAIKEIAE